MSSPGPAASTFSPSRTIPATRPSETTSSYPVNSTARPEPVGDPPVDRGVAVRAFLRLGVGPGPVVLLLHEPAEPGLVDGDPVLGRHLEGEVDGEAVGVVQRERLRPGQLRPVVVVPGPADFTRATAVSRIVVPGGEGAAEGLLLRVRDLADPVEAGPQLGVGDAHPLHRHRQQVRHGRLVPAEQPHRAHRAAQHPAQHVAAALVAGRDAVADEHEAGPDVVGDDPQPHVVGAALRRDVAGHCAVALAGHLGRPVEDRPDLVDLVEVVDALQDAGDPLQAHAGVDVLLRQRSDDVEVGLAPHRAELELGEDEVPDLQEAVLVDRRAAFRAVLAGRGRRRSRCRDRPGRECPCASSCRAGRAGRSAPSGCRSARARAPRPRRRPRRRWPTASPGRGRSGRPRPAPSAAPTHTRWRRA